jgi:16S rRNA (uracil1498-N3)-methyltransferase
VNLLLIEREELSEAGHVTLADRRAEHLRRVLGVEVGQRLNAGIVCGPRAVARVIAVGADIELVIESREASEVPSVDLILAVPRPKALPRTVQAAASFGVRRIDIINAWRVDPSYFSSHKLSCQALRADARLGCEQGRQTYVPEIEVHRFFVPYVAQVLGPRLVAEHTRRLIVAHPAAATPIEKVLAPGTQQPVVLAVGPDGGFLECEIGTLVGVGGELAHLGQAVLRSEIAVAAILSQIDLLRRLPATSIERA